MPRLSADTLLQKAITYAIMDRNSFADCYEGKGYWADEAISDAETIKKLTGKKLILLNLDEQKTAFKAFIFAEQWHESLMDAQKIKKLKMESKKELLQLRNMRLKLWGKSELESKIESASEYIVCTNGILKQKI